MMRNPDAEPRTENAGLKWRADMTELEEQRAAERAQWKREERQERERADAEHRIAALEAQVTRIDGQLLEATEGTATYVLALENELARRSSEVNELKLAQARIEKNFAELELRLATAGKVVPPLRAVQ
jgi:hypothetical protein